MGSLKGHCPYLSGKRRAFMALGTRRGVGFFLVQSRDGCRIIRSLFFLFSLLPTSMSMTGVAGTSFGSYWCNSLFGHHLCAHSEEKEGHSILSKSFMVEVMLGSFRRHGGYNAQ